MTEANCTYIYGSHACGKGVLLSLLDGHSRLAVSPIHDVLPKAFCNISSEKIEQHIFYEFRERLCDTRYYQFEDIHHGQPISVAVSEENRDEIDNLGESLDFYAAEKQWTNQLKNSQRIEMEDTIRKILDSIFSNWDNYPYQPDDCKYFVGMGSRFTDPMETLIESCENSKIIFIRRDPRAVVASKGSRQYGNNRSIPYYLKNGRIREIEKQFKRARDLEKEYPKRVLIIRFEDIILNTDITMKNICKFLGVEESSILMTPTRCGQKLGPAENYIGEIKDDWEEMMEPGERFLADLQMRKIPKELDAYGISLSMAYMKNEIIQKGYQTTKNIGRKLIN